jgi:hypothetical protein
MKVVEGDSALRGSRGRVVSGEYQARLRRSGGTDVPNPSSAGSGEVITANGT